MAAGDKLPVVMGKEKAVPNGVATLGADGKLAEAQRPTTDATPTEGSENPVQSGGVYTALAGKADLTLSNLSNYQKALRNIGGRPNRNLLDNWYFVGGGSQQGGGQFPINQRGETSWSVAGRHLDRWNEEKDVAGSIGEDGYHIGNGQTVVQRHSEEEMNQLLGKTVTVSCLLSDGSFATATGTIPHELTEDFKIVCRPKSGVQFMVSLFYSAKSYQFGRFQNASGSEITVVACKTELGPTQTLAYQDEDGAWQLFETPDYGEELAKCQRYLLMGPLVGIPCVGAYVVIPTPVMLRTVPTAFGTADAFRQDTNQAVSNVSFTVTALNSGSVTCLINGLSTGFETPYYLNIPAASGLSAEL